MYMLCEDVVTLTTKHLMVDLMVHLMIYTIVGLMVDLMVHLMVDLIMDLIMLLMFDWGDALHGPLDDELDN